VANNTFNYLNPDNKMKAIILSYGHVSSILPLYKRLCSSIDIDLILVFTQRQKIESIISFTDINANDGFLDEETTNRILSRIGLDNYYPRIRIFIYHNNRTRSLKNTYLSLQLSRVLKGYDIIHTNGQHTTFVPLYYFIPSNKKRVFSVHDYKPHSGEGGKYSIFGCYWTNRFMIKTGWPVVIQNKADFRTAGDEHPNAKDNILYIPVGPIESYLHWHNPQNGEYKYDVLFFGRISSYKGIEYLLDAMMKIQEMHKKNIRLCIAGSGSLKNYEDALNKLENVTLFNRYIESEELVDLIQKSKIIVCPYTDATQSGVAMTAFAFNKPVVATAVGGLPDIVRDDETGYLVQPGDSEHLAESILKLVDDENNRNKIEKGIEDFKLNSRYNWKVIAGKYIDLYTSL
jgi:glycosyltransferase involved in cell wall biosynthesis